ncbi:hypothetical protein [Cytobacillus praedii]|uniref:hypothetical protein n=1 Tax=Cytobacillus praedii TaxID=1742358 RepID=UPI002E235265|nr:hypothetical protein [Cytobacillus praedii]
MEAKYVLLTESITFNGAIIGEGEIVQLPIKSAKALIEEGKGITPVPDEKTAKTLEGALSLNTGDNGNPHLSPSEDPKDQTEEELSLIRKALDDKYKGGIPTLKEHAKEAGVEFPYDANKGEIIEAVITAGKAEAVLAK